MSYLLVKLPVGDLTVMDIDRVRGRKASIGGTVYIDDSGTSVEAKCLDMGRERAMQEKMRRIQAGEEGDAIPKRVRKRKSVADLEEDTDDVPSPPVGKGKTGPIRPAKPALNTLPPAPQPDPIDSMDERELLRAILRKQIEQDSRIQALENAQADLAGKMVAIDGDVELGANAAVAMRDRVMDMDKGLEAIKKDASYAAKSTEELLKRLPPRDFLYTFLSESEVSAVDRADLGDSAEVFATKLDELLSSKETRALHIKDRKDTAKLEWIISVVLRRRAVSTAGDRRTTRTAIRQRFTLNAKRLRARLLEAGTDVYGRNKDEYAKGIIPKRELPQEFEAAQELGEEEYEEEAAGFDENGMEGGEDYEMEDPFSDV